VLREFQKALHSLKHRLTGNPHPGAKDSIFKRIIGEYTAGESIFLDAMLQSVAGAVKIVAKCGLEPALQAFD
jgi:hypothetical protein